MESPIVMAGLFLAVFVLTLLHLIRGRLKQFHSEVVFSIREPRSQRFLYARYLLVIAEIHLVEPFFSSKGQGPPCPLRTYVRR
jgi:hypothetical protein